MTRLNRKAAPSAEAKRAIAKAKAAAQERAFLGHLRALGLDAPIPEHRFHAERKWRFDYSWPDHKIAVEVEGGAWTRGRHTRGSGFIADMEKYSEAAILGWCVIRVTPKDLCLPKTAESIARAYGARRGGT